MTTSPTRGYSGPDDDEVGPVTFETGDPSPVPPSPVAQNVTGPFAGHDPATDGTEAPLGELKVDPPVTDEEAKAEAKKAAAAKKSAGDS